MHGKDLNIKEAYFKWMCTLICGRRSSKKSTYHKLLQTLHDREFVYTISLDGNRAEDGIDLRYRFGEEERYSASAVTFYLDERPCSVLEMMVALAIRCEEHIMDDPEIGDRTSQWFWGMIDSLGLSNMRGAEFDRDYTNRIVSTFLDRKYEPNGAGGLFTVKDYKRDLRHVEIWYQMCWYLEEMM